MRTRRRPAPAAESMALRVGLDGGEVERGGRGFAEARAATAAPEMVVSFSPTNYKNAQADV